MTGIRDTRRDFLKKSAIVAAAGNAAPYFSWSRRASADASANDRLRIGCVGFGGMAFTWIIGTVVDRFSYTPVFVVAGMLPLVAVVIVQWLIPQIAMKEAYWQSE